jgi:hypothetical protein
MALREYWMTQGKNSVGLPFAIWQHCFREWLICRGDLGERLAVTVDNCGDSDQVRLLAGFCGFPVHDPDYLGLKDCTEQFEV